MNVICSRSEFRDALRVVAGVVDPKNIKPILKDIRIRTVDGALELSATDLEVGIKYVVKDVEIKEEGGIVVPADPVTGIVSESQDERLTLTIDNSSLVVTGAGSKFQVRGVSQEEFPQIPDFPSDDCLEIEGAILSEMVEKTIFAVAVEKQRYALNGVLLVAKEKSPRLTMVGTDGRRMALIKRKANAPSPFDCSSIIPVKAVQQVNKMVGGEEIVRLNVKERQVLVQTEKAVLVAQLVEGRFPPYEDVIPDDNDKKIEMQSKELANCVKQAAVLSSRDERSICFSISKDKVIIESSSAESGEAHVEMAAKYEGDDISIRFHPDYLLDGLKAIGNEPIKFEMKDSSRAAVMRTGGDFLYLIMPITKDA